MHEEAAENSTLMERGLDWLRALVGFSTAEALAFSLDHYGRVTRE